MGVETEVEATVAKNQKSKGEAKPTFSKEKLEEILSKHVEWLALGGAAGERFDLSGCNLQKANLKGANLREANLEDANLKRAKLFRANLKNANLKNINLKGANLEAANLQEVNLQNANLQEANLYFAKIQRANLKEANLKDTNVTAVAYCRTNQFKGLRLGGCYGSTHFEIYAKNQAYIEELLGELNQNQFFCFVEEFRNGKFTKRLIKFKESVKTNGFKNSFHEYFIEIRDGIKGKKLLYALWNVFADCGRTPWRWLFWMFIFILYFANLFFWMGQEQFRVSGESSAEVITEWTNSHIAFKHKLQQQAKKMVRPVIMKKHQKVIGIQDKPLPWNRLTTIYYSVVTFSTLGFGDITPRTTAAALVITIEVLLGYIMLGGLISIFATLVTRRF